jgi:hypothetical protein
VILFFYIFLLCANVLSCALIRGGQEKLCSGIQFARGAPAIIHIFFADDSFCFFKVIINSMSFLKNSIQWFCDLLGLVINLQKSELLFNPNSFVDVKNTWSVMWGIKLVGKKISLIKFTPSGS